MTERHRNTERDTESATHQRAPFSDPLADGMDPTAPGAPHEPGGVDYAQSEPRSGADRGTDQRPDGHDHRD